MRDIKDWVIVSGLTNAYIVDNVKKGVMSNNRRVITDNEILALLEFYATKKCVNCKCSTFGVVDSNGEEIMEIEIKGKLLDAVKAEIKENKE